LLETKIKFKINAKYIEVNKKKYNVLKNRTKSLFYGVQKSN